MVNYKDILVQFGSYGSLTRESLLDERVLAPLFKFIESFYLSLAFAWIVLLRPVAPEEESRPYLDEALDPDSLKPNDGRPEAFLTVLG